MFQWKLNCCSWRKRRVCAWGWVFFWLWRANYREHLLHSLLACFGWTVSRNFAGNSSKWAPVLHWKWSVSSLFHFLFCFLCKRKNRKRKRDYDLWLLNAPGDAHVQTSQSLEAVFVNSGDNPFELIRDSIKYVSCSGMSLVSNFFHVIQVSTCYIWIYNDIGCWRNTKELSVVLKTRGFLHILTGLDGALGMLFTLKWVQME